MGHNNADALPRTLPRLVGQIVEGDEILTVDNPSSDDTLEIVRRLAPTVRVVQAGENLGYAGGSVRGAAATSAPLLLFLNPDAAPAAGALAALRAVASERADWGAWQALVTLSDGTHINTAGNVVHYLGFGWAGELGKRVEEVNPAPHEIGFTSGAALVVRRAAWDAIGGFDPRYFMYAEDLDLCLRLRLAGWRIGVVPAARVAHDYAFVKGDYKWFYLERNRWWTLLGVYPLSLLALLAPALAAFELAILAVAWRGRWLHAKVRSQGAVMGELPAILRRRREVQRLRSVSPRQFASGLSSSLDSPYLARVARIPGLDATQRAFYCALLKIVPNHG